MLILAIETSTTAGSLALLRGERLLAERGLELGVHHGQSLVPEIKRLLAGEGVSPRECELIAVSVGPGSFTGLRVGIVCAKTLAYAIGCRVVAVDTHLAIASNAPEDVARVQVVTPAQQGDVFDSCYRRGSDGWFESTGTLQSRSVAEWLCELDHNESVTGPALARLAGEVPAGIRRLEEPLWRPTAATIGAIGFRLAASGKTDDMWSLEPTYVRRSSAEEKWDLRQRK